MLITYTCLWAAVKSYDMTGSCVYIDYSEWRAVYAVPGEDYNLHRIALICEIATELRYVDYLFLYKNNNKNHMTWQGRVLICTNPSDVQCIQHQVEIIMHIELCNYVN
jgi:hypothetical protein